jgi:hypothetical protein
VPWCADDKRKGFVIFMSPPITQDSGPRGYGITVHIKGEHAELKKGRRQEFALGARCRAHKHQFTITVRFWSHPTLPKILVSPPPSWDVVQPTAIVNVNDQIPLGSFFLSTSLAADLRAPFILDPQ